MTDIPRPAEGDTSWTDWADDVEATTDQIHAATSAATANTLVQRDAAGRFKAADGLAATDVATKGQVDTRLGIVTGSGLVDAHKVTQAAYDALGAGRPGGRIYFIVG